MYSSLDHFIDEHGFGSYPTRFSALSHVPSPKSPEKSWPLLGFLYRSFIPLIFKQKCAPVLIRISVYGGCFTCFFAKTEVSGHQGWFLYWHWRKVIIWNRELLAVLITRNADIPRLNDRRQLNFGRLYDYINMYWVPIQLMQQITRCLSWSTIPTLIWQNLLHWWFDDETFRSTHVFTKFSTKKLNHFAHRLPVSIYHL